MQAGQTRTLLVSNPLNRSLYFQQSVLPKETVLGQLATFAFSLLGSPVYFVMGVAALTHNSITYFNAKSNQLKMVRVLTDETQLAEYAAKRIEKCQKEIASLKYRVLSLMSNLLKKPEELYLPTPKGYKISQGELNNFPWDQFLDKTNFLEKAKTPGHPDRNGLLVLECMRVRLVYLSKQLGVLSTSQGDERLEVVRKIAEISFVKNSFIRQSSKEWAFRSILWLLPAGLFWDLFFNSAVNNRATYEGKKDFLPQATPLAAYNDLLDAHNQLIQKHDFLVPYINHWPLK